MGASAVASIYTVVISASVEGAFPAVGVVVQLFRVTSNTSIRRSDAVRPAAAGLLLRLALPGRVVGPDAGRPASYRRVRQVNGYL